jgi:hypothetical protein
VLPPTTFFDPGRLWSDPPQFSAYPPAKIIYQMLGWVNEISAGGGAADQNNVSGNIY